MPFDELLNNTGEVGEVEAMMNSVAYVAGLPGASQGEMVLFENGGVGQVLGLLREKIEVVMLSKDQIRIGEKVARSGELVMTTVGEEMLGEVVDPLGRKLDGQVGNVIEGERRLVNVSPPPMKMRRDVVDPMATGVALVDLVVPLAKGQKELVVGDRKTGKSGFLMQALASQARQGVICIYAAIAKKRLDIGLIEEGLEKAGIREQVAMVVTEATDPSGLVYLTPYTALTAAEYFRDQGRDVLVVLDDMTAHAKYYREVSLLIKRFPGRGSYPGDIFYVHAKLMERGGNFENGSITILPVAEVAMGDLSGYIQTNLMAMTDGHIYFDSELYNEGRRPAINPFLSVTRVGRQAQTELMRQLSSELTGFLVRYDRLRTFLHFGAEVTEATKKTLSLGDKVLAFLDQPSGTVRPVAVSAVLLAALWAGMWSEHDKEQMLHQMGRVTVEYEQNEIYRRKIHDILAHAEGFEGLVNYVRDSEDIILEVLAADEGTKKG